MAKMLDILAQKIVDRLIRRIGMDGIRVATINAQPGDLVIIDVHSESMLPKEVLNSIERKWESLFANNRVVVTQGMSVSVIHAPVKPLSGRS